MWLTSHCGGEDPVIQEPTMTDTSLVHNDSDSLEEALAKIGRREDADEAAGMLVFRLTKDVSHWKEYDIYTSRQLWDYLESC